MSFGDKRRDRRFIKMVEQKVSKPTASIPELGGGWSGVKLTYAFYDNDKVKEAQLASVLQKATVDRCLGQGVILHVMDTTNVHFSSSAEGLGYLDHGMGEGLMVHSSLALDAEGCPLGVLHQKIWARDRKDMGKKKLRAQKDITQKESYRWVESMKKAEDLLHGVPLVLHIADRESDLYELFATPRSCGPELLLRATHDRSTLLGHSMWEEVEGQPVLSSFELQVPKVRSEEVNKVHMQLKAGMVVLSAPKNKAHLPALILYGIIVRQTGSPPGEEPLQWRLISTLPLSSPGQAMQWVQWYAYRWRIERLHYVLKSGCRLEDLQLRSVEALRKATILYSLCAFKILQPLYLSRTQPQLCCTSFFPAEEWKLLSGITHKHPVLSNHPPTLKQCVMMLAKLGGYLARNSDGPPGIKNLWRGMQNFNTILQALDYKKQWLSTS